VRIDDRADESCEPQQETTMRAQSDKVFLIGKDSRGHWVAQKQNGCCGGFFVSYAAALKFALVANGNRPDAVIAVPGILELSFGGAESAPPRSRAKGQGTALSARVRGLLSRAAGPAPIAQPA
jgi:hypothetical protein